MNQDIHQKWRLTKC